MLVNLLNFIISEPVFVGIHNKFDVVDDCIEWFRDALSGNKATDDPPIDLIDIDGVRVIFDGGWGLVRASNTQPVLVLRCEAQTETRLKNIKALMDRVVAHAISSREYKNA